MQLINLTYIREKSAHQLPLGIELKASPKGSCPLMKGLTSRGSLHMEWHCYTLHLLGFSKANSCLFGCIAHVITCQFPIACNIT